MEKNLGKLKKNLGNVSIFDIVAKKNRKIRSQERVERHFGVALTESEFQLYSGVAEVLWQGKLIKAPTLYYFSKYAMKTLVDFVLATAKTAQEQVKPIQRSE